MKHPDELPGGRNAKYSVNNNNPNNKISKRSNIMKYTSFVKTLSRSVLALLAIALIATMAFGQHLVIGTGSTYGGSGNYVIKGNITNPGVAATTTINGTVTMSSSTQLQTIGTATNGEIDFGTLNISTSFGVKSTTAAVATKVATSLSVADGSKYDVGATTLTIDAASTLNSSGTLASASGSNVIFDGGSPQTVLAGFTYGGKLTFSGAGAKTMNSASLTTVTEAFSHTGSALTISSGGLTLTTTGAFAAVNNNGGTITGGSGAATFSSLLTQGGGSLSSGSGGLALNAGLTNTSGNITVGSGQSMSVSGGQFAYTAGTLSFDNASTVTYGSGATSIVPSTYGNLTLNTDAKIFPAGTTNVNTALTANSNMTINGTLAMAAAANASISGDFADAGTFTAPSGAGVVTFGGAAQAISGSASPSFKNLTIGGTGTKTATTGINIASGGQLAVNQTLAMSGANVLTMKSGANAPSFTGQTEITGSMAWEAPTAAAYTFNNSATVVTFAGADASRTFTLNSTPGTYPTVNSVGHTVKRSYTASYTNWSTGTVDMQLAYLQAEGSTLGVTEAKLKDFQNGGISSANKVVGTPSRLTSGAASFGYVNYLTLTTAQLLPATNNALAMDDRFNMFNSIASTAWDVTTTWDAGAVPTSTDDVVITGTHAVTIPNALAAAALSVTIDAGTNTLTVGGGTSGTLAIGTGGLTNNSTAGGLSVVSGGAVTITGSNLTNNGAITNAGTITVN
jgi:filamentous hemagglutinin